jgi:GTP cyclohydrolase II
VSTFRIVDWVRDVYMQTPNGRFQSAALRLREPSGRESEHVCLYRGIGPGQTCLLRLHSACITSELFGCQRCDCAWQLAETLRIFRTQQSCAIVYTQTDEGRGHGIIAKLRTYFESDGSPSSGLERRYLIARDLRNFHGQAFVAHWLGIRSARLLSNNRAKHTALAEQGINVIEVVELRTRDGALAEFYTCKDQLLSQ